MGQAYLHPAKPPVHLLGKIKVIAHAVVMIDVAHVITETLQDATIVVMPTQNRGSNETNKPNVSVNAHLNASTHLPPRTHHKPVAHPSKNRQTISPMRAPYQAVADYAVVVIVAVVEVEAEVARDVRLPPTICQTMQRVVALQATVVDTIQPLHSTNHPKALPHRRPSLNPCLHRRQALRTNRVSMGKELSSLKKELRACSNKHARFLLVLHFCE
jgi:hypothetical protein